ncbi:hypothetical protein [Lysobacter enzymogenes]|uniref:hypothetical protein n=1 Tax=Lysobacter enzymogenes TaxID=69 RepID=UPI000F4BA5C8|nr:hypothetical protein [Lysobacter enzymogenes]
MSRPLKRIAVVDDDDEAAMTLIHTLEDADLTPFRVAPLDSIELLVSEILKNSDAAVCDHRLRYGGFSDVSGAELAARLIQEKHPTILVTQYLDQEADVSIRKYRSGLPVVLRRDEADEPSELRSAFARCLVELNSGPIKDRKPQRTLIRVLDVVDLGGETVIDAVIHGWNSKDSVRFPASLIPSPLLANVERGTALSVVTNIRAEEKVDLYFEDFQIAEEPDQHDGLG